MTRLETAGGVKNSNYTSTRKKDTYDNKHTSVSLRSDRSLPLKLNKTKKYKYVVQGVYL